MGVITEVVMWADTVLLVLIGLAHHASAMNVTSMEVRVPRVAFVGDDVELECVFPWLDPVYLYSIRWWRDNEQFYQYIPKKQEPKMQFNVRGINVDKRGSSEFRVILRDLGLTSSGAFTCEVISDENFETFRKSSNMTVIDPPDGSMEGYLGPVIEASGWIGMGPLEVNRGQKVEALCKAIKSNPPVFLDWFINGTKVSRDGLRSETYHLEDADAYTSTLLLIFSPEGLWDDQGRILLQCAADLPDLFHGSAMLELHNPELRRTQLSGFLSSGSHLVTSLILEVSSAVISVMWHHLVAELRTI